MTLRLDTHALLWWWTNDLRLSATARAAIADETNDIWVSAASAWEIATQHRLGKCSEPQMSSVVSTNSSLLTDSTTSP